MVAKTGVARLALTTGAPVIPIARLGHPRHSPLRQQEGELFPRKTVRTGSLGKPVDLSEWAGKHTPARALRAATDAIMGEVTALVAQLRQEEPPALPDDPSPSSRTVAGSTPKARPAVAADPVAAVPDEAEPEVTGSEGGGARRGTAGTTFALVLADAGTPVTIWARSAGDGHGDHGDPREPQVPAGIPLPASLTATDDAATAVDGADLVVFAVPASTLRACLEACAADPAPDAAGPR